MTCVLLQPDDEPVAAVVMAIFGYEIDNWDAYIKQTESFTDAYIDFLKYAWKAIAANLVVDVIIALAASSGWPLVIAAAGAVLIAAAGVFIALWAPADPIIRDSIGLSMGDLAILTSGNFPAPPPAQYVSAEDIEVNVSTLEKGATDYLELRKYRSDDEDSEYHMTLRYTRVS